MKLTKTELRKLVIQEVKALLERDETPEELSKRDKRERFEGNIELFGGVEVGRREAGQGDAVIFSVINFRTDSRDYYFGIVEKVEDMGRRNTTGGNMIDVLASMKSVQSKKASKTGETTATEPVDPKIFSMESYDARVLKDQRSWRDKLSQEPAPEEE
tara:strand:+ start:2352 stop:2825 length:474 start_codon:yes stop_codon:yes gene_type:complete